MERGGLGRSLTSILSGSYDTPADNGPAAAASNADAGLSLAYETLTLLVRSRQLRDAVAVVDDPTLGRQLLVAGRRPLTADDEDRLDGPPGCHTDPSSSVSALERELVHRICAAALRCAALEPEPAAAIDQLEIALRRLPGVFGVALDEEDPIVEVHASSGTEPDLARRVGSLARAHLEDVLTVDLVRRARLPEPPAAMTEPPAAAEPEAGASPVDAAAPTVVEVTSDEVPVDVGPSAAAAAPPDEAPLHAVPPVVADRPGPLAVRAGPELVRARTLPGHAAIEVQLRGAGGRGTGHAPRKRGLTGAAEATLSAYGSSGMSVAWARVTRTTADGRCVVAVALRAGSSRQLQYGVGGGANPIEAASRATLHAVTEPRDSLPASCEAP